MKKTERNLINLFTFLFLGALPLAVFSARIPLEYKNKIYEEAIHTVILQQNGSEERLPAVSLGKTEQLYLRFDELRPDNDYYQYKFIHCTFDWKPSGLQFFDFIEGDPFGNIEEFSFAQNTYFQYTHYALTFPKKEMRPKISGNYLLVIYRNFEEEDIILTQRFMVVDEVFKLDGYVDRSNQVQFRNQKHEIDFTVQTDNYEIPNPMMDINAVILQNMNWSTAISGLKPRFINRGVFNFNYDKENNFWAGNEFRTFDIRSLRTMSPGVERKFFDEESRPVARLFKERSRATEPYLQYLDYNGKMVLDNRDGGNRDPNISSDYVKVEFTYISPGGELPQPIYLYGEMTNWELNDEYRMFYDSKKNVYFCDIILKQGYYSYWYVTPDKEDETQPDLKLTEGNHFQTENDYHVLIYHRNQFLRYDELLGTARFSSAGTQRRD